MSQQKRSLFGINIDAIRMPQAVRQLREWIEDDNPEPLSCRYVVTPNVDHTVLLQENQELVAAYRDAHLILADGHPIVWASRLLRQPLPERVAGSELVPRLFDSFNQEGKLKVFLLGARPGVAAIAAEKMKQQWPNVTTVGVYSPPLGFEHDADECNTILGRIALSRPDLVVVVWARPNRKSGCINITSKFVPKRPFVLEPRSIFWPGNKNGRRGGCSKAGSNGFIECAVNRDDWSSGTPRTPGYFPSL